MSMQHASGAPAASALHLLHRAGQCADELFAVSIGAGQLTPRQYEVLRCVAGLDEPSQTILVEKTGIDRSTLADIVRRLVERGLLARQRTRQDARMYAVNLTDAGRQALGEAEPAVRATNEKLLGVLSTKERDDFLLALKRVIDAATKPQLDEELG